MNSKKVKIVEVKEKKQFKPQNGKYTTHTILCVVELDNGNLYNMPLITFSDWVANQVKPGYTPTVEKTANRNGDIQYKILDKKPQQQYGGKPQIEKVAYEKIRELDQFVWGMVQEKGLETEQAQVEMFCKLFATASVVIDWKTLSQLEQEVDQAISDIEEVTK